MAVPLFFIISGYFSFPVKDDTFTFLKKRLTRIVFSLLVWLFLYTLCFSKPNMMVYDFFNSVQAPQLWYLYALVGLALLIPLTSGFICNASKKELQLYIAIWGLTLIFNGNFFDSFLVIETNHNGLLFTNPISALLSFYGYFGYLLLGYYFGKFNINKRTVYGLLSIGCIIILVQYFVLDVAIDRIIAYCSLGNVFISSSIFLWVKETFKVIVVSDKVYNVVCKMGELTFGIYLTHWLLFQFLYKIPGSGSWNCIVTSIVVFGLSAIVTYLISFVSFKKYVIG